MRNVRFLLSYDGSHFYGWQRQDGFESVQEALEDALEAATGQRTTVHGAGRTDTGVHALGQVANAHIDTRLEDDRLRHAVNAHLPGGVVARRVETCPDDFHARFGALGKRYLYLTCTTRFRPALGAEYAHWVNTPLDRGALVAAAGQLVGTHDFASFGNTGSERKTTVRTIRRVRVIARRERFALVVEGDGFLYNMVRTIAGTLLEVGAGKRAPGDIERILAARDRAEAGATAPARGLYLVRVHYPGPVFQGPESGPRGAPGLF